MSSYRSPYSRTAIGLHWVIAILVVLNVIGGLSLGGIMDNDRELGIRIVGIHKSIGLTVLILSLWRLFIRLRAGFPRLPAGMPIWEVTLSRVVHIGFYAMIIAMPLSGWTMSSAGGRTTMWFGLFAWPNLPVEGNRALGGFASDAHGVIAWLMIATVLLHVAGALKHHFLNRDDVLQRMLPFLNRRRG